jgi:hypothetical protein
MVADAKTYLSLYAVKLVGRAVLAFNRRSQVSVRVEGARFYLES